MARPAGRFDWKEVDCFLRPQSVLCDDITPGYGRVFLFLTSAYRTFAIDGYFDDPSKHHFAFASTVVRARTGLEFDVDHVGQRDLLLPAAEARLQSGWPVLVPACAEYSASGSGYHPVERAHFFIVSRIDRAAATVAIRDNLHAEATAAGDEYAEFTLASDRFAGLCERYWDIHVARGLAPAEHADRSYWLLQIRPGPELDVRREGGAAGLILAAYRELAGRCEDTTERGALDDRHLRRLQEACDAGAVHELEFRFRAYLADCNLAGVHLQILVEALRSVAPPVAEDVASRVEAYVTTASAVRTRFLANCLAAGGAAPPAWRAVRSRLAALGHELTTHVAGRLATVPA